MSTRNESHPFEIRRKIAAFKARFAHRSHEGAQINPDGIALLLGEIREIEDLAVELTNELSRHRWNEAGRIEGRDLVAETVLAEVKNKGSNVRLFPVVPRTFSDGGAA